MLTSLLLDQIAAQMLSDGIVSLYSLLLVVLLTHMQNVQSGSLSMRHVMPMTLSTYQISTELIEKANSYKWNRHRGSEPLISSFAYCDSQSALTSRSVPPDLSGDIPAPSVRIISQASTVGETERLRTQQSMISFDENDESIAATAGMFC